MRTDIQESSGSNASSLDSLCSRLAQVIQQSGLNQSEFSRELGVSPGFVSDVVRGQKKPGAEFLHSLKTIDANPTAKVLLLLLRNEKLGDIAADPVLQAFLDEINPDDSEISLATELYNGRLWASGSQGQQHTLLEAAIAHFEARKPLDTIAALTRTSGSNVQINFGSSQRNAGRDYYE
jgi:transcriptional regulator with XRE-family HTH domain